MNRIAVTNFSKYNTTSWITAGVPDSYDLGEYYLEGTLGKAYVFESAETKRKFINIKPNMDPYGFKVFELEHVSTNNIEPEESVSEEINGAIDFSSSEDSFPILPTLVAVGTDGKEHTAVKISTRVREHNGSRYLVFTDYLRFPGTKLYAELTYYAHSGYSLVDYDLLIGNSDPNSTSYKEDIAEVFMYFDANYLPILDNDTAISPFPIQGYRDGLLKRTLFKDWLNNGQSVPFTGVIFLQNSAPGDEWFNALARYENGCQALCLDWDDDDWTPFKTLPAKSDKLSGGRGALINHLKNKFVPWNNNPGNVSKDFYMGMGKRPAQTGDHDEYGFVKGQKLLLKGAGGPEHIFEIVRASLYNAFRPIHFRESNVKDRPTIETHPNCYFWSGNPHYISWKEGWDTLGKLPGNNYPNWGIEPHDSSHGNFIYSPMAYVLTGRVVHLTLCEDHAEAVRFERRFGKSAHPGLLGIGEARATRAEGALCYIYWATRNKAYKDTILGRLNQIIDNVNNEHKDHEVFTFHVHGEDDRKLNGKYPFTMPWQWGEAIAWTYAMLNIVKEDDEFPDLVKKTEDFLLRTTSSWIDSGWWKTDSWRWAIGDAVAWKSDGSKLTEEEYRSDMVHPHFPGTAFDMWNTGPLYIAKKILLGKDDDMHQKATEIYNSVKQFYAYELDNEFPKILDFDPWFTK
jgi:hypothetical protein